MNDAIWRYLVLTTESGIGLDDSQRETDNSGILDVKNPSMITNSFDKQI